MTTSFFEFAKNNFPLLFYVITFFVSLKYYRKYFDTVLKYLPLLLAYTLLNEVLGHIIRYSDKFAFTAGKTFANDIIYNVYDLFYFGFYYYLFWRLIKTGGKRNIVKLMSIAALLSYAVSCFFQNPFEVSLYIANAIASFVLVAIILLYLNDHEHRPGVALSKYNLMTWISMGLLIFHSFFPFLFVTGYVTASVWYDYDFQTIIRILIVVMNVLFCIGFVKARKKAFG